MQTSKIEDLDELNMKNDSGLKKRLAIDGTLFFYFIYLQILVDNFYCII